VSVRPGEIRTDLSSHPKAMARGAAVNLAGAMAAMALTFLFNFVITHVVSVHGVGLFAIATTVVSLTMVPALLGLETGTVRFVALAAGVGDEREASGSLQVSIALVSLTSFGLTLAIWLTAPWLAVHFFHKPDAATLMRIVALSLPGLALGRVLVAGVQGFGVMSYSAWLGPLRAIVNLLTALPLLAIGLNVTGLAWSVAITSTLIAIVAFIQLLRVDPGVLIPARGHWHVNRMLRFSLPQTLTAALFFTIVWTDTIVLSRFRSAAEVGIYAIVGRLLNPATLVSTAVGQMFGPRIAAEDARGDRRSLTTMLKRVTYWNTAVSAPFFAVMCVLPVPLLALFGPRYTAGAAALVILAAGQLVNTAAGPLGQVINLSGRPYITLANNALVGGTNIAVALILIPRYGITGAAIATASALTFVNLIKLVEVHVLFNAHPFRLDTARTLVAVAMASALVLPLEHLVQWPGPFSEVMVLGSLLFLAYALAVVALGIEPEDRELLSAGGARMARMARTFSISTAFARALKAASNFSEAVSSLFGNRPSKGMVSALESLATTIDETRARIERTRTWAPSKPDEEAPKPVTSTLEKRV
jgi:O-antigen/teichoic acid export membrane protein